MPDWKSVSVSLLNNSFDHFRLTYLVPKFSAGHCIFLNDLMLSMLVKLVDKNGDKAPDGALVAPINTFPTAMFRQLRVFLNEVEISSLTTAPML